ncbi:MAG: family 43 glycosylhydrolase [Paucibacter sp.]|nr:family 43 glycosylhydrolase [Roseateles sp.]
MRRRTVLPLLAAGLSSGLSSGLSGCGTQAGKMVADTAERTSALFKPAEKRRYANPVIEGGQGDPTVCRVGEDFFLVASSFEYFPALTVHHSRDLVHWRALDHALNREGQVPLKDAVSGEGVIAPSLRWHGGRFWLLATSRGGGGTFLMSAKQAMGPWSDPQWIEGLDPGAVPSLFIDGQGKAWLVHEGSGGVFLAEFELESARLRAATQRVWPGHNGLAPQLPVLVEREGWIYLFCTEGRLWDQGLTVARSRSAAGPYEPCFDNPIASHRNAALEPLQMLGRGEPVQAANGTWWLLLSGTRPVGRATPLGREVLLAPMRWDEGGWPVVNDHQPVAEELGVEQLPPAREWPVAPRREDFKGPGLPPEWQFLRGLAPGLWDLAERPGWLRLKGSATSLADVGTPAFVCRRLSSFQQHASTLLDFAPLRQGQQAGLALRRDEAHHALLRLTGSGTAPRRVELMVRVKGQERIVAAAPLIGAAAFGAVRLRLDAYAERYDFSYAGEGADWRLLGSVPFNALAGDDSPAGLRIGLYASGPGAMPPADFDWFELES